jgi:hypothetical protein
MPRKTRSIAPGLVSAETFRQQRSGEWLLKDMAQDAATAFEDGALEWLLGDYLRARIQIPEGNPVTNPAPWDQYQAVSLLCRGLLQRLRQRLQKASTPWDTFLITMPGGATNQADAAAVFATTYLSAVGLRRVSERADHLVIFWNRREDAKAVKAISRVSGRIGNWHQRGVISDETRALYDRTRFIAAPLVLQEELPLESSAD